jgi:hypothetical protein
MAGVIFGFDDDDPEVFDRTRQFLNDHRVGYGSFSALTPFPGTKLFDALHAQSRITTYDWSKYDGATAVFVPKQMTPEQLQVGTRRMGVNFYSTPKILRRIWTNRHHPFIFLASSFAWRHSCRVENRVPLYTPSGLWTRNANESLVPAIEGLADPSLLLPAEPVDGQKHLQIVGDSVRGVA